MRAPAQPWVVFLMGPTASGKTDLAVQLVQRKPFEIISVDSALIYTGMDIGTAKPNSHIRAIAPHRLLDILDPAQTYSAAQFRADVLREISEVLDSGRIPLLVGGTMLYFRALQHGLADLPSADAQIRAALAQEMKDVGSDQMHAQLQAVDPVAAQRIHPNDPQRIQRALEVFRITGKTITELYAESQVKTLPFRILKLIVSPVDKRVLDDRIAQRFKQMLAAGFVQEVAQLKQRSDLHLDKPSMRCVGYRQIWEYLDERSTYAEMEQRGVAATRQLAKRQLTWLRSEDDTAWFDSQDRDILDKTLNFLIDSSVVV